MRSLTTTSLLIAAAAAVAGCKSGVISVRSMGDAGVVVVASDGGPGPTAEETFGSRVEPMLITRCGGCHAADRIGPDFLRPGPDIRTTLLSYPALVDLDAPASSRLITKGEHSGPALMAGERDVVRAWIELEAEEGTVVTPTERELATPAVMIHEGFNALPLDALGMPGTSLHFVAERVAGGMFLDSVQVAAGPMGAHLDHPTFVVWIGGVPTPDAIDRFAGLELSIAPNTTQSFDTGTVVLTDFPETALLSVHFDTAEPMTGGADGGLPMGADGGVPMPTLDGCMQLAAFRSSVSPALGTFCTRCHAGGNPAATSAVDMTRVRSTDDAQLLMGCNQILGRISAGSPSASGLFVQPDPAAGGGHPFKFGTTGELNAFRMSVLGWFEMEAM